ncbi:MAG: hypothetical protein ACI8Z1_001627 [Candidatus Azotimanducaceae bacterium]|jgi:hypothetical protein
MTTPQINVRTATGMNTETVEVKQRLQYHDVDESLSEWELARLTSKTWSMEQD